MTGINASKIIQNLQFVNNFASMFAHVCCQSRQRALRWLRAVEHRDFETTKEKKRKSILVFCRFFFFSEIGSGAYGHHPLIGGGTPSSNPMRLLNWNPVSRKGVLRRCSRHLRVWQMGPVIEPRGPANCRSSHWPITS